MTNEVKILALENRINLLEGRTNKENQNIVKKLKRKIKALQTN